MITNIGADSALIVKSLRKSGQLLDAEIAADVKLPLSRVQAAIASLTESGDISTCTSIKFEEGREIRGILCRRSGYTPPRAAGRAPGAK